MLILLSVKYICTRVQIIISNYGIMIHTDSRNFRLTSFNYYWKPIKYISFIEYNLQSHKYREDILIYYLNKTDFKNITKNIET